MASSFAGLWCRLGNMDKEKSNLTMLRIPIARTFAAPQKTLTCRRNYPELAEKIRRKNLVTSD